MRKMVLAICTTIIVFACGILTPVTVRAEGRGCVNHTFNATHDGYQNITISNHPYVISNEPGGPNYGTCYIYKVIKTIYPRCTACGYIDYANPYSSSDFAIMHTHCGAAPYYY